MCCVCAGMCSHVGPHAYCWAHSPNGAAEPAGQWWTTNRTTFIGSTDPDVACLVDVTRCWWHCRLCRTVYYHRDPVTAIRMHLEEWHGGTPAANSPQTPGRPVEPPPTTEALRAAPVGSAGTTPDTRHSIYARVR